MKDVFILFFGVIALIVGITFGSVFLIEPVSCEEKAVSFEGHRWSFYSGCMVKHKGEWLPLDNIYKFDNRD